MVNDYSLGAAFLVGMLGSIHCVGMCGGIVGALSMGLGESVRQSPLRMLPYLLGYNTGRLASYGVAGAIVGYLGAHSFALTSIGGIAVSPVVGGVFMVFLGLYLTQWWTLLTRLEQLGGGLWRRLQPYGQRFLPIQRVRQTLPLGFIWGWLPCGLVYSVLFWSASIGSATYGAGLMLAFGLGTLPMLFAMGTMADRLRRFSQSSMTRLISGLLIILFGIGTIAQAFTTDAASMHIH